MIAHEVEVMSVDTCVAFAMSVEIAAFVNVMFEKSLQVIKINFVKVVDIESVKLVFYICLLSQL